MTDQTMNTIKELLLSGKFSKDNQIETTSSNSLNFYTTNNVYSIVTFDTWMACGVSSRKCRAGEKHTRGRDIFDSNEFTGTDGEELLMAILSYELENIKKDTSKPLKALGE